MRHHNVSLRTNQPARYLPVFRGRDFRVVDGVNEGDPLADAADVLHEDVYALTDGAAPVRLGVIGGSGDRTGPVPLLVSRDSAAGAPGAALYLDSLLTFIGPTGRAVDALIFVEVDVAGLIVEVYLHPLAEIAPKQGYTLVTIDRDGARTRFDACRVTGAVRTARAFVPHGSAAPPADRTERTRDPAARRGAKHIGGGAITEPLQPRLS